MQDTYITVEIRRLKYGMHDGRWNKFWTTNIRLVGPRSFPRIQKVRTARRVQFLGTLATADMKHRAGWLGMWIGQQGREIFKTFTFEEGEKENPDKILQKLEYYVRPRKNKRVARYRLHQRKQQDGETFDNFLKDLRLLVMDCEHTRYGWHYSWSDY